MERLVIISKTAQRYESQRSKEGSLKLLYDSALLNQNPYNIDSLKIGYDYYVVSDQTPMSIFGKDYTKLIIQKIQELEPIEILIGSGQHIFLSDYNSECFEYDSELMFNQILAQLKSKYGEPINKNNERHIASDTYWYIN